MKVCDGRFVWEKRPGAVEKVLAVEHPSRLRGADESSPSCRHCQPLKDRFKDTCSRHQGECVARIPRSSSCADTVSTLAFALVGETRGTTRLDA